MRFWLDARAADLSPIGRCYDVLILPNQVADIAFQNKAAVYDLLFRAAADTILIMAIYSKHPGARIGCLDLMQAGFCSP